MRWHVDREYTPHNTILHTTERLTLSPTIMSDRDKPLLDSETPWHAALENDPAWKRVPTPSIIRKATNESSLTADLLHNDRGIRDMRTYLKYKTPEVLNLSEGEPQLDEVCIVFSLGDGVNGAVDRCHGGFISLMLDEVTGELAQRMFKGTNPSSVATVGLNVSYKRMLKTPAVVLCRAWVSHKPQGRKVQIAGSLEDGHGQVYATAQSIFVFVNNKL